MKKIVSFTTIPSRIENINKTIDSIQNQTIKPDIMYVCIPYKCRRQEKKEYIIPEFIKEYINVKIIRTKYDYGPSMKLLPVLEHEKDPESIIITIDDDHIYSKEFIKTLINYSKIYPDSALGFNGWNVKPLINRKKYEFINKTMSEPTGADVLEGYGGVLYKRKFFNEEIFRYEGFPEIAFNVDDVWISAHLAKNNIKRIVLPGVYCKGHGSPKPLNKKAGFKRFNRNMAIEFAKREYW